MDLQELLMLWSENGTGGPKMNKARQQAIERKMELKRYNKPIYRGTFVQSTFVTDKKPRLVTTKTLQSWTKNHFTAVTYASSNGPVHSRKKVNAHMIPIVFHGTKGLNKVKSINTKNHLGENSINETILARPYYVAQFDKAIQGKYNILHVPVEFYGSSTKSW